MKKRKNWGEKMFKYRVRIETGKDVQNFIKISESLPFEIKLENESGTKQGNAKTLLNVVDTIEWEEVYIISETDTYAAFKDFII